MTGADTYSRPERFAERQAARRVKRRMDAARLRHGLCCLCMHRETTCGVFHCRDDEGRQRGACQYDKRSPKFEFDAATIARFRDET